VTRLRRIVKVVIDWSRHRHTSAPCSSDIDPQTSDVLSHRSGSAHQNTGDELVAAEPPCGARLAYARGRHRASIRVTSRGRSEAHDARGASPAPRWDRSPNNARARGSGRDPCRSPATAGYFSAQWGHLYTASTFVVSPTYTRRVLSKVEMSCWGAGCFTLPVWQSHSWASRQPGPNPVTLGSGMCPHDSLTPLRVRPVGATLLLL
jgi:hypothetical protein